MYEVVPIDLSAAFDKRKIVDAQKPIQEFFFLDIPLGASFKMRVGQSAAYFTVSRPFSMEPRGESNTNNGIYATNDVAQPGVVVEMIVVYAGELSAVLT